MKVRKKTLIWSKSVYASRSRLKQAQLLLFDTELRLHESLWIFCTFFALLIKACVAADSFPFSGGAEIERASEKRANEGARLGWATKLGRSGDFATLSQFSSRSRAFGKGKETAATQAMLIIKVYFRVCTEPRLTWWSCFITRSFPLEVWKGARSKPKTTKNK